MPDDPRVQEFLDRLSDSDATPEEVCGSCVDLLPVVRDRWRQMCRARDELDALFPPEDGSGSEQVEAGSLPVIPGYEIQAELGQGGMGVVYRARHVRLNRVVALKMVLTVGPQERERFRREAEAAAALRHPNVVQVHDVGDAAGRPYLTMEYLDGGSLAQKLEGKPLPIREAAGLVLALTGAVEAAHNAGIVHRDLKPANVLLTADGTPKVADFGLARRLDGEAGLTRTGAAVGTPSYMAPEQAGESKSPPGPPADVYSLGAILYELLTGRPPFQAGNAAVTIYRALTQDAIPPSRQNAKVPRDLETVCLKCLGKEPRLRYPSAAGLGDDLRRFLAGEAIAARPEGPLARLARSARRRPVLSTAVAVAVLTTAVLIGFGAWTLTDRAAARRTAAADREATERAADEDLKDMSRLLRKSSWPEARAALERAKVRLGDRTSDEFRHRIARGERDLTLAARLEAVRLERAVSTADRPEWERSAGAYAAAFREAGLGQLFDDPDTFAGRVEGWDIRPAVADALDDWALCVFPDTRACRWLQTVAGGVDPDPSEWRARARAQRLRPVAVTTAEVAEAGLRAGRCDPLLIGLGRDLAFHFQDPVPFLARVQKAHPGDLFANLELAEQLVWQDRPAEAVRYYQAALAVRPDAPAVCAKLGLVLGRLRRNEEAVEYLGRSARLAPASAEFRRNFVCSLLFVHRNDEAVEQARMGFREVPETARTRAPVWDEVLDVPAHARLHATLGDALVAAGRDPEAADEYRLALALEPALREAFIPLRQVLVRMGRFEDLRDAWRAALDRPTSGHNAYYGYAELCLYLGRKDDYLTARRELLRTFSNYADPAVAERAGRACLLLPATGDELRQATALADRAATLDREKAKGSYPYFQFAGGLADYRRGNYDRAVAVMRGEASKVLGPAPKLVLAMALYQKGELTEARKELAAAVASYDWGATQVNDQDGWIYHSLRREAEALIQPDPSTKR